MLIKQTRRVSCCANHWGWPSPSHCWPAAPLSRACKRPRPRPDRAGGRQRLAGQTGLARPRLHGGRRQPAGGGGGLPDDPGRWQRGGRRHRSAAGVDPGGTAILRHRRRLPAAGVGWPESCGGGWPRDGPRRRHRSAVHEEWQADGLLRRRGGRALSGRPRHGAGAGTGPPALRQAALGCAVRARHHPRGAGIRDKPAAGRAAGQGPLPCQGPGRTGLLLSGRRQPQSGGNPTDQPGPGQGAANPGKPGAGRLLSRPAGRGHGGQGARPPNQPRGAERGRSRQLSRQAARRPLL